MEEVYPNLLQSKLVTGGPSVVRISRGLIGLMGIPRNALHCFQSCGRLFFMQKCLRKGLLLVLQTAFILWRIVLERFGFPYFVVGFPLVLARFSCFFSEAFCAREVWFSCFFSIISACLLCLGIQRMPSFQYRKKQRSISAKLKYRPSAFFWGPFRGPIIPKGLRAFLFTGGLPPDPHYVEMP